MGKSSLMYEVGVFQEGSDQVKVSAVDFSSCPGVLRRNLLLTPHQRLCQSRYSGMWLTL